MENDDRASPDVAVDLLDQPFDLTNLVALRATVAAHADAAGLASRRIGELVLLVHELASNAVRHGGGLGRLRMWTADGTLLCQVSDDGPGLSEHHFGTTAQPALDSVGGRGIWLVRELCDRVDWRSGPTGTTVTVSVGLG
jgi:anti-sigma regulatory factor (Ser/Thr protein kinase)